MMAVNEAFGGTASQPRKRTAQFAKLDKPRSVEVPAAKESKARPAADDDWLQSQVDRLVGEVQRSVRVPFPSSLLSAFWRLPLEDQNEVLLGALGSQSEFLEAAARSTKMWTLIKDEVAARL